LLWETCDIFLILRECLLDDQLVAPCRARGKLLTPRLRKVTRHIKSSAEGTARTTVASRKKQMRLSKDDSGIGDRLRITPFDRHLTRRL